MNKSMKAFALGLGFSCLLCAAYWLYKGAEWQESVLAMIIGLGAIAAGFWGKKKSD